MSSQLSNTTASFGDSERIPTVSVIIPTFNEARNIPLVFAELPDVHEIIVVDGHSHDETVAVVRSLRPDARIIMQNRRGKGNALACGFAAATGDIIVMLDADGSADPGEIQAFVDALRAGADFAKGTRFAAGGGSSDITRLRRLGNKGLSLLVNSVYGTNYTDLCYGYNAFWREHLPLIDLRVDAVGAEDDKLIWGDGFEVETLINVRIAKAELRVVEVPSYERDRVHGVGNLNAVRDGLRVLRTIGAERRRSRVAPSPTLSVNDTATSLTDSARARPENGGPSSDSSRHLQTDVLTRSMTDSTGVPPQRTVRRVCVVGSSFRFMSGISMYTCCLANAFADDFETSAVLMRRLIPRRLYPGRNRVGSKMTTMRYRDSVDVFDGIDYFWVPSIFRGISFLMRNRPEVVVFQWWSGAVLHTYLLLAVVARLIGARIILEFHETLDTAEARIPLAGAYVRLLGKPFMRLVSAGVVHSAGDVSAIREKYPVFRDREVAVVPMGPYDHEVDPNRRQPAKPGTFRLLYFGTIRPYKGVECLIRAFDALPDDIAQRFTLTIVGETWEGWTLPLELIKASPRRGQITFVNDYVTDEQAAQFFRSADGVVLPYLRSSGSGPLHMTMSHGLPVAVTAVGGLVEAVDEYTGARLVRPNDIADLAAAIAELPAMTGPHQDPHSWRRTTRMIARLFEPARPPLSLVGPDMAHPLRSARVRRTGDAGVLM